MLTIAAVVLSIRLGAVFEKLRHADVQPACGIETTSYRFVGEPGTSFTYAGEQFVIPESGSIELIHSGVSTYQLAGRRLPLELGATDEFGRRTVQVPSLQAAPLPAVAATANDPNSPLPAVRRRQ